RDGRSSLFGGRPIYYGITELLIHEASLVIGHFSTAMAYAVAADLPVVVLSSDEFERSGEIQYVKRAAAALGVERLNINHMDRAPLVLPKRDKASYDRYRRAYLAEAKADLDGGAAWKRVVRQLDEHRK